MAKSSNQKIKILYLMKIFTEYTDNDHGLSVEEIISMLAEYGVVAERKAIYDDIETLRTFGMDIEKRKDKTVRYHLLSREFELPELKLLVDAVQSSKFITRKKSNELIKKIERSASKYEATQLERQVFVANRIKTMNESIYYTVDYLHEAIITNRMISFHYFDWNEKKEKQQRHGGKLYIASPWALSWDNENYYMIAFDSDLQKIKHYRVDKMLDISLLDRERDGKDTFANFDMALYSKKVFGMYGGEEEIVCLRCKNSLAGVIIDRFGLDTSFFKYDNDHFEVNVKIALSPVFLTWVMNFGAEMKIVSPQNVIDKCKALAQEILDIYN